MTSPSTSSLPIPLLSTSTPDSLEIAKSFADDHLPTVFIASYPKSGTTWMQCIIYNLLTKGRRQDLPHISHFTPFFDTQATFDLSNRSLKDMYQTNHVSLGYHVFNTHFLHHMLPQAANMKYIYVVRSGRDAVVSFYHHLSNQDDAECFTGSFSEFLELFLAGKLPYGSRAEHVKNWWTVHKSLLGSDSTPSSADRTKNCPILFVRYEDQIHDLRGEVRRLIQFLNLSYTEEELEGVLQYMSFQYMKAHKQQFQPLSVPWKPGYEFIRKGKIGDHETMFTAADDTLYEASIQTVLETLSEDAREELSRFLA